MSPRRYRFRPAYRTCIGHGPDRQCTGRPGDVVEIDDDAYRDVVLATHPGEDGKPCLVPLDDEDATEDAPASAVAPVRSSNGASLEAVLGEHPARRRKLGRLLEGRPFAGAETAAATAAIKSWWERDPDRVLSLYADHVRG